MALASAIKDRALDPQTGFVGEVALSGAIRPVAQPARRLAELARLGLQRAIVPTGTPTVLGIMNTEAATLRDALQLSLPRSAASSRQEGQD
jgi:DNA repair protein RadA/Sms